MSFLIKVHPPLTSGAEPKQWKCCWASRWTKISESKLMINIRQSFVGEKYVNVQETED